MGCFFCCAKTHSNVHLIQVDVGSDQDVQQAVLEIEKRAGGLDVLVSNAGVSGNLAYLKDSKPEDAITNIRKYVFSSL